MTIGPAPGRVDTTDLVRRFLERQYGFPIPDDRLEEFLDRLRPGEEGKGVKASFEFQHPRDREGRFREKPDVAQVEAWTQKVRGLAEKHGMVWTVLSGEGRFGGGGPGHLMVALPETQAKYFAALHEIGHVARPARMGRWSTVASDVINQEISAWEWALENAGEEPGLEARELIAWALHTYIRQYENAGHPVVNEDYRRAVALRDQVIA